MPRRFALALVTVLLLVLAALVAARLLSDRRFERRGPTPSPTPVPTPVVPPTPIPPRPVALYFESGEDGMLHPEAREVTASADEVALLRSIASAVLEGPRRPELLRPFPDRWSLRAAFRMAHGLAVLDLAPPPPPPTPTPAPEADEAAAGSPPPLPPAPRRWETGSHEELYAVQALVLSVTRNLPSVTRVVLLVGGEPVETLAGHVDLTHPLDPDGALAVNEPPLPVPTATPEPTPGPAATAAAAAPPAPTATPRLARTPAAGAGGPAVPRPGAPPSTPRPTPSPARPSPSAPPSDRT